jgi:pilus assembly protein CpaB
MERRAFLISISLSVFAMYMVYQYVTSQDKKMQDEFGTFFPMVVASRDILQFETIRPTDIETIRVPAAMKPPGLIADPKDVIDAVAAVPLVKGEQVLDNKIISKNVYSGLDTQIAVGRRAISIPVNVKSSLGYMLRPGDRVDMATYFEYKTQNAPINEEKVFLQDILVLASGRTIQPSPPHGVDQNLIRAVAEEYPIYKDPNEIRDMLNHAKNDMMFQTVTFEVTPIQAQVIVYVMSVFNDAITVMLRHPDDRQLDRRPTTNLADVMGPESYLVRGKKLPPPRAIPRPRFYDLRGNQQIGVGENY